MIRSAAVGCLTLLVCGPGFAQNNRLGDVAGSIKLDRKALVEQEETVVDPGDPRKADQDLLQEVLQGCSAQARRLAELVATARSTYLYRGGDDFPTRLRVASVELSEVVQELYLLRLVDRLRAPVETGYEAADLCIAASASVEEELDRRGVGFVEATEAVGECLQRLGESENQLKAVVAGPGSAAAAPMDAGASPGQPAGPPTPEEIVATRCAPERSNGQDAYDACEGRQFRAQAAIESRTPDNEQLDEAAFSEIREFCLANLPTDFVRRDECEQDRMTALRLELE